jgi:hypothetical protein
VRHVTAHRERHPLWRTIDRAAREIVRNLTQRGLLLRRRPVVAYLRKLANELKDHNTFRVEVRKLVADSKRRQVVYGMRLREPRLASAPRTSRRGASPIVENLG